MFTFYRDLIPKIYLAGDMVPQRAASHGGGAGDTGEGRQFLVRRPGRRQRRRCWAVDLHGGKPRWQGELLSALECFR